MRIYLAGQGAFGRAVLAMLVGRGHELVGVSAPLVRGDREDPLWGLASDHRLPRLVSGCLNASTMPSGVDLLVCAHSHDFIGRATRLRARHGAIGYHPSLLPLHRGRDAVRWTIRMRDRVAGGSVYWLSDTVDGGPVAAQRHVFVRPDDDASELWRRDLFPLGVELLDQVVSDISAGRIVAAEQDDACATWEPSVGRAPLRRPDVPLLRADNRAPPTSSIEAAAPRAPSGRGRAALPLLGSDEWLAAQAAKPAT